MGRALRIVLIVAVLSGLAITVIQVVKAQQTGAAQPEAGAPAGPTVIDETTVALTDMSVTVSATGTVIPERKVDLNFEISAPVADVLVQEGQRVKAGDVLARLDTTDVSQALQNAEIALLQQQVSYNALVEPARQVDLDAAKSAVNAAQAAAGAAIQAGPTDEDRQIASLRTELAKNQLWQAQLQRDETLGFQPEFRASGTGAYVQDYQINGSVQSAETGVAISESNMNDVLGRGGDQAALGAANAQLVQAQIALDNLINGPDEVDLQQAQIAMQRAQLSVEQARAAVAKSELVAPFDGVVATNNLVVGEIPPATSSAFLFINDDTYYVDLAIDENDISGVKVDQPADLSIDALGNEDITGVVKRVALTPTKIGTLVSYTVRIMLNATDAPVRADMTATSTITVNDLKDVLVLPNRFIRIDRATQKAYATIQGDDGKYKEVEIVLGVRNESDTQVISGLQAGQRVVLLPRDSFNPFGG